MAVPVKTSVAAEPEAQHRFSFGYTSLEPLAALLEAAVVLTAGFLSTLIYQRVVGSSGRIVNVDFLSFATIATITFVTLSYLTEGYETKLRANRKVSIIAALRMWGVTLGFMALCAFLFKISADFSRATVLLHAALGAGFIVLFRALWPDLVRRALINNLVIVSNIVVIRIGDSGLPSSWTLDRERTDELRANGLRPVGWISLNARAADVDLSAMVDYVENLFRRGQLNEIVVIADHADASEIDAVVERLRVVPLPVRAVLDPVSETIMRRSLKKVGSLVLSEYQRAPFTIIERALKRSLDIAVSLLGMILLSPILLLAALAVKRDTPGPVLFRQTRRGFGGKTFMILKFRSMTVADNGTVIVQAKRDDARITRVGALLRRTSIDELPQLWNVFVGEMSIVGPRPHAVAHDDYYSRLIDEYAFRHHAKPGLTGWAQVKGLRGETPLVENMQARVEKDIWYINNWSIWLDVSIIARTALVVVNQKTAY